MGRCSVGSEARMDRHTLRTSALALVLCVAVGLSVTDAAAVASCNCSTEGQCAAGTCCFTSGDCMATHRGCVTTWMNDRFFCQAGDLCEYLGPDCGGGADY